jgi:hypothetical protein
LFCSIDLELLYEYFVTRDFEDYVSGAKEDKLYWILASIEGSYEKGQWDQVDLHDAIHWAIMLGFDIKVLDSGKKELVNSDMVISMLSPSMKRRMKDIGDVKSNYRRFQSFPSIMKALRSGPCWLGINSLRASSAKKCFSRRGKRVLIMSRHCRRAPSPFGILYALSFPALKIMRTRS